MIWGIIKISVTNIVSVNDALPIDLSFPQLLMSLPSLDILLNALIILILILSIVVVVLLLSSKLISSIDVGFVHIPIVHDLAIKTFPMNVKHVKITG